MALVFSSLAAIPGLCQETSGMAGISLSSIIYGCLEGSASYAFGRHWSVSGEGAINCHDLMQEKSDMESEHDSEFKTTFTLPQSSWTSCSRIIFSYWPIEAFNGPHISIGIQSSLLTDIVMEAGYMICLWKGLHLSTTIRVTMIQGMNQENFNTQNLRFGLHYKF